MGDEVQETLPGLELIDGQETVGQPSNDQLAEDITKDHPVNEPLIEEIDDNDNDDDDNDKQTIQIPPEMRNIIGPLYNIQEFSFIEFKNINLEEQLTAKKALYWEIRRRAEENGTKNFIPEEDFLDKTVSMLNLLIDNDEGEKVSIPYPFIYKTYREEEFTHYLFQAGKVKWEVLVKTNLLDSKNPSFTFHTVRE